MHKGELENNNIPLDWLMSSDLETAWTLQEKSIFSFLYLLKTITSQCSCFIGWMWEPFIHVHNFFFFFHNEGRCEEYLQDFPWVRLLLCTTNVVDPEQRDAEEAQMKHWGWQRRNGRLLCCCELSCLQLYYLYHSFHLRVRK